MLGKITDIVLILGTLAMLVKFGGDHLRAAGILQQSPQAQITTMVGRTWNGDFPKGQRKLTLVLSDKCTYCNQSAPFYRRLMETATIPVLAVFAPGAQADAFLARHSLQRIATSASDPSAAGVQRVPTLALLDENDVVLKQWTGMLSPEQEGEVFSETSPK